MTILDLEQEPVAFFPNPIEVLQFYIPRVSLDEYSYENRTAIVNTLTWPHCERDARRSSVWFWCGYLLPDSQPAA